MMAVCGIGMPIGWRNSAVTANQSASAPTIEASAVATTIASHGIARLEQLGDHEDDRRQDEQPGCPGLHPFQRRFALGILLWSQ